MIHSNTKCTFKRQKHQEQKKKSIKIALKMHKTKSMNFTFSKHTDQQTPKTANSEFKQHHQHWHVNCNTV